MSNKKLTRTIPFLFFSIVVLTFAFPPLAEAETPSDKEIEMEIEKDLKQYFSEHPEEAVAFFNKDKSASRVGTVYNGPAFGIMPYGPAHRLIPYIYKYGERGLRAAFKVYKKLDKACHTASCFRAMAP